MNDSCGFELSFLHVVMRTNRASGGVLPTLACRYFRLCFSDAGLAPSKIWRTLLVIAVQDPLAVIRPESVCSHPVSDTIDDGHRLPGELNKQIDARPTT